MRSLALTLIALALVAGGAWLSPPVQEWRDARAVAVSVRRTLLDPDAAHITDVQRARHGAHWCGRINAKNRLGAYTGAEAFAWVEFEPGTWALVHEHELPTVASGSDAATRLLDCIETVRAAGRR